MDQDTTFKHLMVDIETMGNQSFSSIISIAAVEFDINTGETGKQFYTNIDLQSCLDAGLIVNASTVMWWMQQNEQARNLLVQAKGIPIAVALHKFAAFCNTECQIWGNAAKFDLGILQNAYDKLDLQVPWKYRNERCVRTLAGLAPDIKEDHTFNGTPHNALHDCHFQIGYCSKIWQSLNTTAKNKQKGSADG